MINLAHQFSYFYYLSGCRQSRGQSPVTFKSTSV